jgi:hypothetical protein
MGQLLVFLSPVEAFDFFELQCVLFVPNLYTLLLATTFVPLHLLGAPNKLTYPLEIKSNSRFTGFGTVLTGEDTRMPQDLHKVLLEALISLSVIHATLGIRRNPIAYLDAYFLFWLQIFSD